MAGITGTSSIDVNALVTQLVAVERAPTDKRFNTIQASTQARISAFGQLTSALNGLDSSLKRFEGEGAFPGRKATVGADAGFSAAAGTKARLGSYSIQVERLATAHKLQSAPAASSTQVGHGRLTLQVGDGTPVDIDIASGEGTLSKIAEAINAKTGTTGVNATIVRGDDGDVLTLSSTKLGTAGRITVTTSGGDGGLGVLATTGGTIREVTPAADARVLIDGVVRTSSANTLTDAIDGVTLTLTKPTPGSSQTLDVASDPSTLKAALLTFVSSYNTALSQMRTQSAVGKDGKASGTLSGDSVPRSMMQGLRSNVSAAYADLSALGFKTAVDGSLSLDGSKFDTALAADPAAVDRLFGTDGGLGRALRGATASYVGDGSLLQSRTESLNKTLKDLSSQRDKYEVRIAQLTTQYRKQFSALDSMISRLQSTSTYLSQQLTSLQPKS